MKLSEHQKKLFCLCLVIPVLLISLAYAGGYLSQFMINYQVWTSSGGTPGNGTAPVFPSASVTSCLKALTVFPYSLYGIFLMSDTFWTAHLYGYAYGIWK